MARLRLGRISFTNCLPIFYALEQGLVPTGAEIVAFPPTTLNRMFAAGEVEITAVSSLAYGQLAGESLILPDLAIAAAGEVQSVLLVSKVPLADLDRRVVAVTTASATSAALLEILCRHYYHLQPQFKPSPGSWRELLQEATAALVLGDDALQAYYQARGLYIYDMAKLWQEACGEKMVFAVWAVKRAVATSRPEAVAAVWRDLLQSRLYGQAHPREIAAHGAAITGLPAEVMADYFACLHYGLERDYLQGLRKYLDLAWQYGLLPRQAQVEIWGENLDRDHCRQGVSRPAAGL